jgi:hypothetical protein
LELNDEKVIEKKGTGVTIGVELISKFLGRSSIRIVPRISNNLKLQTPNNVFFPSDAIKTAKDITSTIQKIFTEYQKIYTGNYNDIKNILQ